MYLLCTKKGGHCHRAFLCGSVLDPAWLPMALLQRGWKLPWAGVWHNTYVRFWKARGKINIQGSSFIGKASKVKLNLNILQRMRTLLLRTLARHEKNLFKSQTLAYKEPIMWTAKCLEKVKEENKYSLHAWRVYMLIVCFSYAWWWLQSYAAVSMALGEQANLFIVSNRTRAVSYVTTSKYKIKKKTTHLFSKTLKLYC